MASQEDKAKAKGMLRVKSTGTVSIRAVLWLTPAPRRFSVLLAVLSLLFPKPFLGPSNLGLQRLDAQETPNQDLRSRFFFTTLATFAGPGPGGDFEDALKWAGYGDIHLRGGHNPRSYPRSHYEWGGIEFELGYEHSSKAGFVVSAGGTRLGVTNGFSSTSDQGDVDDLVSFRHSIRHLSPAFMYRLGPVRASLGPTFLQVRTHLDNGLAGPIKKDASEIGVSAGLGFSTPLLWPILNLELRARYRFVGNPKIDDFSLRGGIVQGFKADFNHWQVGAGLGLHLRGHGPGQSDTKTPLIQTGPFAPSATEAGIQVARSRSTLGYAAGSFLGGTAIGLWGWFFNQIDCRAYTLWGVGTIGVTSLVAHLTSKRFPEAVEAELENQAPEYEYAFRDAYRKELRSRQRRSIILGGLSGIVAGTGTIFLLLALSGGA